MECRVFVDFMYFNLNDLAKTPDDYSITDVYMGGDVTSLKPYTLQFNFC